jgi:hypothetical protein
MLWVVEALMSILKLRICRQRLECLKESALSDILPSLIAYSDVPLVPVIVGNVYTGLVCC